MKWPGGLCHDEVTYQYCQRRLQQLKLAPQLELGLGIVANSLLCRAKDRVRVGAPGRPSSMLSAPSIALLAIAAIYNAYIRSTRSSPMADFMSARSLLYCCRRCACSAE